MPMRSITRQDRSLAGDVKDTISSSPAPPDPSANPNPIAACAASLAYP